jgi:FkbM family methyltransferase
VIDRSSSTSAVKDLLRIARREWRAFRGSDLHVRVSKISTARRLGSHYGGWVVLPDLIDESSVVYGVGVGDDVSWDLAMIRTFGCTVHGFDPTPRCRDWITDQDLPAEFVFHPLGLADRDTVATFVMRNADPTWSSYNLSSHTDDAVEVEELEVRRLTTLMSMLGHERIDLLKIDIEGAEYEVISDLVASGVPVGQLCVEFHFNGDEHRHPRDVADAISELKAVGFIPFDRSPYGRELSFVHLEQLRKLSETHQL